MLSFPPSRYDKDETLEQRMALYEPTAEAIVEAVEGTDDPSLYASVLLAIGHHESRWSRYVLEGRCKDSPDRGARCDWSKTLSRPTARGPWQVHSWCREAWKHPDGSIEATKAGARCALLLATKRFQRCSRRKAGWAGAFAAYRGQTCSDGKRKDDPRLYRGLAYASTMQEYLNVVRLLVEASRQEDELTGMCLPIVSSQ